MTRKPGKDDLDLWRKVARTAKPRARGVFTIDSPKPRPTPVSVPPTPLPRFEIGARARDFADHVALPVDVGTRLDQAPVEMDRKSYVRMKRGKLVPEARIDLHGMTLDQAHPALTRFVIQAQARGLRLLLVITGKGDRDDPHDPMPIRRGVLKRQVPLWLRQAPLSPHVLQITEAHRAHGGAGAYYVYLRRSR